MPGGPREETGGNKGENRGERGNPRPPPEPKPDKQGPREGEEGRTPKNPNEGGGTER
jgi:hypothetical protein